MSITASIRKRPWLLLGMIIIALLAFLINPESMDKMFGQNPNILGKVNGEEITRDEFNDQLSLLQQQSQGQPQQGLEEQAWQILVQSKLIKQQFDKMGLKITDEIFWNQLQFDPMFSKEQNPQNFDEKGNFKVAEIKKQIEELKNSGDVNQYNEWLKAKKAIQYRMMARQLFANVTTGITANKKEAAELMKQRDEVADIDFVKVDYAAFAAKNPVKVTTEDLANYIKKHPVMFKSEAARNLGIVYFPAKPSAADDALALKEINKLYNEGVDNGNGLESFKNTPNDSMFVELNSEAQIKYSFVSDQEIPQEAQAFVKGASVGQFFGPYKSGDKYYVTKLVGKSSATMPKHILFAYKGAMRADEKQTRTKEEAKKLADSIGALVKADPLKFNEYVQMSDEPGAAQRGGMLSWILDNDNNYAKPFGDWVKGNAKGAVGVVETDFGYHIIVNENKMPVYKIANLAKDIRASKETENKVYTEANTFIQSVQGKSFNDFANGAKKKNFNFQNPKSVKRFQGQIQGLGTDKDEEILAWAFNKEREKGETNIFTTGNGDYIVVYLNGKQEAGIADPESVREQVEPIVRNQLLAKKISEKITASKATNLDAIAKLFGTTKQSSQVSLFSPFVGGAMEAKVAGAAFGVKKGKISKPVEGATGVFVVTQKAVKLNKQPGDAKQIMQAMQQQGAQMFSQSLMKSLLDNAKIEDYRIEVWDKTSQAQ